MDQLHFEAKDNAVIEPRKVFKAFRKAGDYIFLLGLSAFCAGCCMQISLKWTSWNANSRRFYHSLEEAHKAQASSDWLY